MSDYMSTWRSNEFKVKHKEDFKWIMDVFQFDVSENQTQQGKTVVSIAYNSINSPMWYIDREDDIEAWNKILDYFNANTVDLPQVISHHLQDGEVAVVKSVGHEKARYINGHSFAVNSEGDYVETRLKDVADKLDS